ncbi:MULTISPECIES: toxin [unclassified Mycobacterium]|uniref:toxin n=1 Tax=Mycobacteriaceae TaxID=1762 RepID=UPI001D58E6E0|nr:MULTISPECIES: toxin [unclassified Mycobacterium]MCA2244886.1 toxin [Mycobacterium sp. WUMAC-067]MCA2316257.1 toxin [Mycobacterium sp. WUMAC-025]
MIRPGDIVPRRDAKSEMFVIVLSNPIHLAAETGRVITCPYIPGEIPNATMAMVVPVADPNGVALPELVQWLPTAALDEPIGNIGPTALHETTTMVTALIS